MRRCRPGPCSSALASGALIDEVPQGGGGKPCADAEQAVEGGSWCRRRFQRKTNSSRYLGRWALRRPWQTPRAQVLRLAKTPGPSAGSHGPLPARRSWVRACGWACVRSQPAVGDHPGPGRGGFCQQGPQRGGREIGDRGQPDTTVMAVFGEFHSTCQEHLAQEHLAHRTAPAPRRISGGIARSERQCALIHLDEVLKQAAVGADLDRRETEVQAVTMPKKSPTVVKSAWLSR